MISLLPAQIEAAEGAARILDHEFLNPPSLADLAMKFKISPYHLWGAFYAYHGATMPAYVRHRRNNGFCQLAERGSIKE